MNLEKTLIFGMSRSIVKPEVAAMVMEGVVGTAGTGLVVTSLVVVGATIRAAVVEVELF